MKKFLIIIALFAVTYTANAQKAVSQSFFLLSNFSLPLDTVTNTGTRILTTPVRVAGDAQTVTIGTINVNLTGTMAGVSRLYGSIDGVHYSRIRSSSLVGSQVDSLLISANSLNYHWIIPNNPYTYYQVQTTGIGTVTFTNQSYLLKH